MNMHGIIVPRGIAEDSRNATGLDRIKRWIWQRRVLLTTVVLPVALLGLYLFAFASDQYESEAHFLVRSQRSSPQPSGLSQAMSVMGVGVSSSGDGVSVADYLSSHDAADSLRREDRFVDRFHRPDVDFFSRLRSANPTPEKLLKYYRKHVLVEYNTETGITTLRVRSFQPEDSYELIGKLLKLGEQRVNYLNVRSYSDSVALARHQLADAETRLSKVQSVITRYRENKGDINPLVTGQAQIGLVATLNAQLAAARAQQVSMGRLINQSSPQYQAVAARVRALEGQIAGLSSKLSGGNNAIATNLGGYEDLQVRQQFLAKRYDAAAASLDQAREQALRQQLYLVRIVEPNKPVKALYPERWRILGTVAIALLLAYSIGWLIVAGVREHAA
jgi:capsular polysaccharide transport system permease protein